MNARVVQYAGIIAGLVVLLSGALAPAAALLMRAALAGEDGVEYTFARGLLLRSVLLAGAGAGAALVFSIPGAFAVARLGRLRRDGVCAGLLIAPLLFPSMVYAFGWDRLLKVPGALRCVWVWASWAWPLPALILGSAWARLARGRFEAALLSTSRLRAFVYVILPMLGRQLLASGLVLFAVFLGDYATPHACGLIVYATELLLAGESTPNPRSALVGALPVVVVIGVALAAAFLLWRDRSGADDAEVSDLATRAGGARALALGLAALCVGVPLVGLMCSVSLGAALAETLNLYAEEVVISLGIAAAGGAAAVLMGAAVATLPGVRNWALGITILWAALPGALIGSAVVSAYVATPVYDHWLLLVIGYVARYGWVGLIVGWLAHAGVGLAQAESARCDGAGAVTIAWRVALAGNLPTLACGALVITALNLSEACTTALVRVPAVNPIALILIEKFHRFEDGILVGMSLILVAAAVPGALILGMIRR